MRTEGDRHLCVCADDFGMSEGINAAVLDLADRGKLCATSCMVRRDAWTAGLPGLRGLPMAQFDVGLHLDLSAPLAGEAFEQGLGGLILRSYLGLLRREHLRAEIDEQLARFEDALGRPPAHIDGHRHVHQLPMVRDMLTEAMVLRYAAAGTPMPWVRKTAPPAPAGILPTKADIVFALGGARLASLAARRGIPTSGRLLGVYDFGGSAALYGARLRHWIDVCQDGDVLMCHPSRGASVDPFDVARRQEHEALGSISFPVETQSGRVLLSPLSSLMR